MAIVKTTKNFQVETFADASGVFFVIKRKPIKNGSLFDKFSQNKLLGKFLIENKIGVKRRLIELEKIKEINDERIAQVKKFAKEASKELKKARRPVKRKTRRKKKRR